MKPPNLRTGKDEHCAGCVHFQQPGMCGKYHVPVKPYMVCDSFQALPAKKPNIPNQVQDQPVPNGAPSGMPKGLPGA